MTNPSFLQRVKEGRVSLGTAVSFTDPCVTEAMASMLDFLWIDAEHNPYSLETIQHHVLAVKGLRATLLVRVPENNPVLIKPVLDLGVDGVIVPLIKTGADAALAVAATHYPPEGIRGYGPRRPADYGRAGGKDYLQRANREIITIVQIEQTEAVDNIDEILKVPGLSSIMIGPNDLAGSMNLLGEPRHPEVIKRIEHVISRAQAHQLPVGLAMGDNPEILSDWIHRGIQWLSVGADFLHLTRGLEWVINGLKSSHSDRFQ